MQVTVTFSGGTTLQNVAHFRMFVLTAVSKKVPDTAGTPQQMLRTDGEVSGSNVHLAVPFLHHQMSVLF